MAVIARPNKRGDTGYMVRVPDGRGGKVTLGTFHTRELAEEAQRDANAKRPKTRRCAQCFKDFKSTDDRRVRCDRCCTKSRPTTLVEDFWLYRCCSASGELLYVGITSTGIKRFKRHGDTQPWWRDVETIKLEHFASREEVAEAERLAIQREKPRFNVQLNGLPDNVVPLR